MIPQAHIAAWRARAPWPTDAQVEQDLVLTRALIEIFADRSLAGAVAFRGGTALHKLFLPQPGRYSEDIDLVQLEAGPIRGLAADLRRVVDPWLGEPAVRRGPAGVTLAYRFETTARPVSSARVKLEINTREHASVLERQTVPLAMANPWHTGEPQIGTYRIEELLGTKLRALYQRRKGRDLYDLDTALSALAVEPEEVVRCFLAYMERSGSRVSRAEFEQNLHAKMRSSAFGADMGPLLAAGVGYDAERAWERVRARLVARLPGRPWRGREA